MHVQILILRTFCCTIFVCVAIVHIPFASNAGARVVCASRLFFTWEIRGVQVVILQCSFQIKRGVEAPDLRASLFWTEHSTLIRCISCGLYVCWAWWNDAAEFMPYRVDRECTLLKARSIEYTVSWIHFCVRSALNIECSHSFNSFTARCTLLTIHTMCSWSQVLC